MNRCQFLSASVLPISFAGCIGSEFGAKTEESLTTPEMREPETPMTTATETETQSPQDGTSACWPSMCQGTTLVEVVVARGFSGDVVLQVDCRGEEFAIQSATRETRHPALLSQGNTIDMPVFPPDG